MPTPVIVGAVRTPQGKEDGALAGVRSEDLSIPLVNELLDRTGIAPDDVDDLLWGCAQQRGEQGNNLARVVSLLSDLGESVPGSTINRWCASSAAALMRAADAVAAGQREVLLAGGVESMSRVPMGENTHNVHPRLADHYNIGELQMGMTAEKVAEQEGVSRERQDEYALRSHERAADATDSGRFDDELVPVETSGAPETRRVDGEAVKAERLVTEDEGIRRDTSLETLAGLPTAFKSDGTVTPGNASQVSDGAAALAVTSREFADENGLDALAEIGAHEVVGVDPTVMGIGPVPAVRALADRTGRDPADYDLVELNEAFAAQTVYCRRELGFDDDRFNVNGGAIAIGHPLGASGARLPVTLVHEMQKRDAESGLATECVGFGQGAAIEFHRD